MAQGADNLIYRLQLPADELAVGESFSVYVTIEDLGGAAIPNITGSSVGIRFNSEKLEFLGISANVSTEFIWSGNILGPFVVTRQQGSDTIKFVDIARSGSQSIGSGPGNVFRMDFKVTETGDTAFEFEPQNTAGQAVLPAIGLFENGASVVYNSVQSENKTLKVGLPFLGQLPEILDFGTRQGGSSTVEQLEITNTGEGKLQATLEVNGSAFRLLNPENNFIELLESESALIPVRFLPLSEGDFSGELRIIHNAGNTASPAVVPLAGEAEFPVLEAVLSPQQFVVRSGEPAALSLQITNAAEQVAVLNAALVGVPAEITLLADGWTGPPGSFNPANRSFSLEPGASGTLPLTFTANVSETQTLTRTLRLSTNVPANPLQNLPFEAEVQAASIQISPESVAWGEVVRGDTVFETFEITNADAALLSGSLQAPEGDFFLPEDQPLTFALQQGESFSVTVGFNALQTGPVSGSLSVVHDGHNRGSPLLVPLSAEVLPFGAPDRLQMVQQPTDTVFGEVISPAVTAELVDVFGNRVTDAQVSVSAGLSVPQQSLSAQGGVASRSGVLTQAALIGDTLVQLQEGIAVFDNLRVSETGFFALQLSTDGLSSLISDAFLTLPRLIEVAADVQTKQLGQQDPPLTFSFEPGLIGDDSFSGALSREPGEDIGSYPITQGTLSLNENYEIAFTGAFLTIIPAQLTLTVLDAEKTFGQSDPAFKVSFDGFIDGDGPEDLSGGLVFARDAGEDAGTYEITASGLSSPRYEITYLPGTLFINPLIISVEALPASKTYGDADPDLVFDFLPDLIGSDTFSGELQREAGEAAGTYPIAQGSLSLSPNYTISFSGNIFSISPAPLQVSVADTVKTYGDADPAYQLLFEGFRFEDDASVLSGEPEFSREPGEDTGTYSVVASALSSPDYELTFLPGQLSIIPLGITITADDAFKQLGFDDPPLTFSFSPDLIGTDTFSGSLAREVGEAVGEYAILQGSLSLSDNYETEFIPGIFEILPGGLVIRTNASSKIFGQADPEFSVSYIGFVGDDDEDVLEGELTFSRAAGEDVGQYPVLPAGLSSTEYEITFLPGNLSISPLGIVVSPDESSKTYGDPDPVFSFTASPALIGDDAFSGSLSREPGELPGSYEILQGSLGLSSNYQISLESTFFEIEPAPLLVTANPAQKTYGEADPEFGVSISGFVFEDDASVLEGTLSFSREAGESVGAYAVLPAGLSSFRYEISFLPGVLQINRKPIVLTAFDSSKIYGDDDPEFTFVAEPDLIAGDSFSGRLLREPGELTGTYVIVQGTLTPGPNYLVDYVPAGFTILQRPLTIQALDAVKIYGDPDPAFEAGFSGFAPEEGPENLSGILSFSREAGEDAGAYAVTPGGLSSGQYDISFADGSLLIETRLMQITADSLTKKEGQPDPELTYTFTPDLVPGDSFNGSLSREPGEAPGNYAVLQGDLGISENYEILFTPGNLEIEALLPAPLPLDPVPANEAVDVPFITEISVGFNQPVIAADLSGILFQTAQGDDAGLTGITLENNRLHLFHEGLANFTEYVVLIPDGAVRNADEAGNEAFSWSFRTKDTEPPVLSVILPEGAEITEDPETGVFLLSLTIAQGQSFVAWLAADEPVSWSLEEAPDTPFEIDEEGILAFREPPEAGLFTVTVIAADASGNETRLLVQAEAEQQLFLVSPETLPVWVEKQAGFSVAFEAEGGTPPYSWSVAEESDALPEGLILNSATGQLSGTPQLPGLFSLRLQLTDAAGLSVSETFLLEIEPAEISLFFQTQPAPAFLAGESMGPVSVSVRNQRGVPADWFTQAVQLSLLADGAEQDLLIGSSSSVPVNGLAFFPGLTVQAAASGYRLRAASEGNISADIAQSSVFQVLAREPNAIQINIADDEQDAPIPMRPPVWHSGHGPDPDHDQHSGMPVPLNGGSAGNRVPLRVELTDVYGNPASYPDTELNIILVSDSETGAFFENPTVTEPLDQTFIPAQQSYIRVYYEDPTDGDVELSVVPGSLPEGDFPELIPGSQTLRIASIQGLKAIPAQIQTTPDALNQLVVQLVDGSGQPVFAPWPGVSVSLSSGLESGTFWADAAGTQQLSALHIAPASVQKRVYYRSGGLGPHELLLSALPQLPVQLTVPVEGITGPPDPQQSQIVLNDGFIQTETLLTVKLLDAGGYLIEDAEDRLSAEVVSGPNAGSPFAAFQQTSPGNYESSYLPEGSGTDQVRLFLDEADFTGLAYPSLVMAQQPARLEAASPATFTGLILAETESPLRVRLLDEEDEPLSGFSVRFRVVSRPGSGAAAGDSVFSAQAISGPDGVAETRFRAGFRAGTYVVEASIGTLSPLTFSVLAESCLLLQPDDLNGNCAPYGLELQPSELQPQAGDSVFVQSRLKDRYGNDAALGGLMISWGSSGEGSFRTASSQTDEQGRAENAWLPEPLTGSRFRLFAAAEQNISGESPLITVTGARLQSLSFMIDDVTEAGLFSEVVTFTLRDSLGNEILAPEPLGFRLQAEGAEQFQVRSGMHPQQLVRSPNRRVRFETGSSRAYAQISQTKSGLFEVEAVQVQGLAGVEAVSGSWQVQAGPAAFISRVSDEQLSGIAGSPIEELPAASVTDEFGNPSPGQPVSFTLLSAPPESGGVIVGPLPEAGAQQSSRFQYRAFTDAEGTAAVPFRFGRTAGLYELEARIDPGMGVVYRLTATPSALSLHQNYPNPFRTHTRIPYEIPETAAVTLEIYDLLGRLVQVLIRNEPHEAGQYEHEWTARNLASGVYFIRLTTQTEQGKPGQKVRPLMLVR